MEAENFKQTFFSFHPKLYRIAFALVENKNDAEDILQDGYYKLWEKRKELTTIQNPEAFCVTMIKNLCLDFLRSPRVRRQDEQLENIKATNDSSPEEELVIRDHIEQIQQLIHHLPENQRMVLRLKGIDNCSSEEIEQITGLSAANVRTLLSRARKTIKEQFEKINNYG